ncbi:MAG: fibronectin type III domain-containing protein [Nitrospirae bacterium]|nr:fibronectin type III domain-containing protein [Nitrospirota bacterium]
MRTCRNILIVSISLLNIIIFGFNDSAFGGEAALSWTAPTTNVDGTTLTDLSGYKVYYGTSSGTYNSTVDAGNVTTTNIINLTEMVTYYFVVTAYDTAGNESNYSNEVSKTIPDSTPPTLSGIATSNITGSAATLTWTTDEIASSQLEYGITTSYGNSTLLDTTMVTSHTVILNGLLPVTTYHVKVISLDPSGNSGSSADVSFTTPDLIPPSGTVSINNSAVLTNTNSVILTLSCTDPESGCGQMQFSEDGNTWSSWENYKSIKSYILSNLEGAKNLKVKYQDNAGNVSDQYTASITLDTTPPVISTLTSGNISSTEAVINWTTNETSTTQAEYGTTTNYGSSTTLESTLVSNHSVTIRDLSSSTDYHYRVKSIDAAGNIALSGDASFTTATPADINAPVISGITITNITATQATVKWLTDEASTTQTEYGTSIPLSDQSERDNSLVTAHTAVLSGLSPDTKYSIRMLSSDASGNKGISDIQFFTTIKPIPFDVPAQITDLRIRTGVSTRNSVTLEWTATGADGAEGKASTYDLRMSKLKIIEDGQSPKKGEITFSKAIKVTGLPSPVSSGTTESFQVSQLTTNSVYYFAIKALDEKGNISAISNVINENNLPPMPVTAIRNGYTMISVPFNPQPSDAQALLSNIVGSPVEVFYWRPNDISAGSGTFLTVTEIQPGYGYMLKSNTANSVLNITGNLVTDSERTLPLLPGWNMVGNPYPHDIPLMNTYIRNINSGELKTYEDAVSLGWVSNALYTYNGRTYSYVLYNTAVLKIWQGYWIAVLQDGQYELVINKP